MVVRRPRPSSWRLAPAISVGDVRFRFEEMAPPTKEPNPVAAARGRRESPAFRGEEPLTSWKRSGRRMVAVIRGKPVQKMDLEGAWLVYAQFRGIKRGERLGRSRRAGLPERSCHDAALEDVHWKYGFEFRRAPTKEPFPSKECDPKYA